MNNYFSQTPSFIIKRHPYVWSILLIILIICIGSLFWTKSAFNNANQAFHTTYESSHTHKLRNVSTLIQQRHPFTVLLLGTDTGALGRHDKGRTDTMILATINPDKGTTYFTSIPRDTKVSLPHDANDPDKINNAYTLGGPKEATSTVQKLLNIPVDYYAVINMRGLEKMVNAVGGVTVTPPLTFHYGATHVHKGQRALLKNKAALDYARMRHQDPLGDYGRQYRQRQILQNLIMKGLQIGSIFRYKHILASLQGNLKTDLSFDNMMAIRTSYRKATHHIKSIKLHEHNDEENGVDYQAASRSDLTKTSNQIRQALEVQSSEDNVPNNSTLN